MKTKYYKWKAGSWLGREWNQVIKVKFTNCKYEIYERLSDGRWVRTTTQLRLPEPNCWTEITEKEAFIEVL